MKPEYDVVIAGAGVAGCMTAVTLGIRAPGLRTVLVDANPQAEVGKKTAHGWICGDAVGEHHAEFVHDTVGITFGSPEIENRVNSVVVCSPDRGISHPFEGAGFVLDRPKFARRLLNEAIKTEIEYRDLIQAVDLLTEGNSVAGVVCQDLRDRNTPPRKISSRLVIDASGMSSRLRRNLTIPSFMQKEIDRDDIEPSIRLIARLADGYKVDSSRCEIYLDAERAPGGYLWMFPKTSGKVNIGLGVQQKRTNKPLQSLLNEWIDATPAFKGMAPVADDGNLPGAWPVSVRHQNDSLVANGFMIVGDAGWFPNPLSAGGIGPSMTGGVIAGEAAAAALQANDVSEANLWAYNSRYVEKYGDKTAALEAFRIYLQTLDNSELNYGLRNFVTHREAVDFTWGEVPDLGFGDKIQKTFLGLRKPRAFRNLAFTISRMKMLNQLYDQYPKTPSSFQKWKTGVDSIFNSVKARFR